MYHSVESGRQGPFIWLWQRVEIVVPALALLVFHAMLEWQSVRLTTVQTILVYGMALIYAALVLWSPMTLPAKQPRPVTRAEVKRLAGKSALFAVTGFALLALLSLGSGGSSSNGRLGLVGVIVAVLLLTGLGTAGLVTEKKLSLDLFPLLRHRQRSRILYTVVAAFFLALLVQLWDGIFGDLVGAIGRSLGETPLPDAEMAAHFEVDSPLRLFLNFLVGAGLFEEFLFRVGIMTPIWALTGRWGWGLIVSALAFGLYHITPLSGMASYNLQAPVTAVLESIGAGLAMGLIYRTRGFTTAVMVHAFGNWLVVMILLGG